MNGTDEGGGAQSRKRGSIFRKFRSHRQPLLGLPTGLSLVAHPADGKKGIGEQQGPSIDCKCCWVYVWLFGGYHEVGASLNRLPCAEEVHRAATSFR